MKRIGRAAARINRSVGAAALVAAMVAGSQTSLADSLSKPRLVDPIVVGGASSNTRPFRIADDATPPAAPPPLAPAPAAAASPPSPSPPPLAPAPSLSDKVSQENMFWDSAQKSNTAADYKAYLDTFPNGVYAPLAKNRITALSTPTDVAQPGPAAPNQPPPNAPPADAPQQAEGAPPGAAEPASGPPASSPEALKGEIGTVETEQSLNLNRRDAMVVQQRLMELGLYGGPIDGDFGPGTRSAIAQWQQSHGAQPTGALGPAQLSALQAESAPVNGQRVEGHTCPPGFHLGPYGHRCWANR